MTTVGPVTTVRAQSGPESGFLEQRRPRERPPLLLAFLCLLIPILPTYSVLAGPLKSNGSPARLIAIALSFLAILGFTLTRRSKTGRLVHPGAVIILAYFLLLLVVWAVGLSHVDSAVAEASKSRAVISVFANVGVAIYTLTRIMTSRQSNLLLGCLLIGLTFNSVVGLLQISTDIDARFLFQPVGFVVNSSDQGTTFASYAAVTERFGAKRAVGTSAHPIEFSVLAAVAVPLAMHFARYSGTRQVRLFAAIAAAIALLAVPVGVSRSGLIALTAGLLIYSWTFRLRQLGIALVAGAVALLVESLIIPGSLPALWKTITNSSEDDSVLSRVAAYARVSQTVQDHPMFGLGLGASPPSTVGFLDNEWLQAIVQGGAVGLLAMMLLAGGGIFGFAARLRAATSPRERDQAYAMGAMFIGILASSYTFDLFAFQQATLLFFILFGLLWSNLAISPPLAAGNRAMEHRASFA